MGNVNRAGTSGKFQDFLNSSAIICQSRAASAAAIINELVDRAADNNPTLDRDSVKKAVFERESIFPTVIAPGLAMPHARIAGLQELIVALATSKEGVAFGGVDDSETVRVAVLVLAPADNPGLHLHVVSALAREFSDLEKIDQLSELTSVDEVVKFFGVVPMRLSEYLKVGDVTSGVGPVVLPNDSLAFVLRKFAETNAEQIPVIDENGGVLGIVTLKNILSCNLPEGVLEQDDLSAIYDFRPYANMLKKSGDIQVSEVMEKSCVTVNEDEFAVQLLKSFVNTPVNEVLAVDKDQRLRGMVALKNFCAKLLWD